ncbi:hypothetical protein [uncultured Oscillibacter sp.]|uniref:hypothetical protein n=1 Tax=uncultured Oscillibacter sp. TaxID=876091 RepID=UPI00280B29E0|nr:hypothetical protein [uncultured Oscillibacter sp.]
MKKIRVLGHAMVTVSVLLEVEDDKELNEQELYAQARRSFGGFIAYAGNGGVDQLIGVEGEDETISADEMPVFDDYQEE